MNYSHGDQNPENSVRVQIVVSNRTILATISLLSAIFFTCLPIYNSSKQDNVNSSSQSQLK